MDDAVLRPLYSCPIVARELPSIMNHGAERSASFELRGCPGIPIADGVYGPVKVDLVQLAGAVVGVGVVPEQASFLRHLEQRVVCD